MNKRPISAALLLLQGVWTWWFCQHHLNLQALQTRNLANLLAPEVLVDGAEAPLWRRLNLVSQTQPARGGQLLGAQRQPLASFGETSGWPQEAPLIESGRYLGALRLYYPPLPAWPLALSWTGALLLFVASWTRGTSRASNVGFGPLLLEVDSEHRVRRVQGDVRLLGGTPEKLIGEKLGTWLDSNSGRSLQHIGPKDGAAGLVMVRDTQAWESLQKRVSEMEAQYRSLCDYAFDLILVCHPEGSLIFANRALQATAGTTQPGQDYLRLFHENSHATIQEHFSRCLMEGCATSFQAELRQPNGEPIPVEGSFCPGQLESGVALTVLGVLRDLTAQRKAEEELRQAQKMEAVGRLASGVAHDFNNLLTVMGGVASLIRCESDVPEAVEEHLCVLDETVHRAAELTRQLLLFSRRKTLVAKSLRLDTVLSELCRLASRLIGEDITVSQSLNSNGWVLADRSELEQIAMNLLVNARDAMPDGGLLELTTIDCQWNDKPAVQIRVRDSGVGMSDDVRQRIFEPYFTTKELGKGTGLGLSTTYSVVTRLQGKIDCYSKPGKGTTFVVTLPTAAPSPDAPPVPLPRKAGDNPESILLVEDESSLCHTTCKGLERMGFRVKATLSPMDALQWLKTSDPCPNLMVTDVVMPGMNGTELARKARQLHPQMKVLYVSGYPGDALESLENEAVEFLPKPYRCEELGQRIRQILDRETATHH